MVVRSNSSSLSLEPGGMFERVIDNRIIEATMATAMDSKFVLNKVYGERGGRYRSNENGRGCAPPPPLSPCCVHSYELALTPLTQKCYPTPRRATLRFLACHRVPR